MQQRGSYCRAHERMLSERRRERNIKILELSLVFEFDLPLNSPLCTRTRTTN
jgi:hypothetical protein